MTNISKGIIIIDKSSEKIRSLPGNLSREKANAPKMVVNVVAATEQTMTITELRKYRANGAFSKAMRKFSKLKEEGSHCGGNLLISTEVLNAEANIQKNGKIMINAPRVSTT